MRVWAAEDDTSLGYDYWPILVSDNGDGTGTIILQYANFSILYDSNTDAIFPTYEFLKPIVGKKFLERVNLLDAYYLNN